MTPRPPISTLFPYTTLFRSLAEVKQTVDDAIAHNKYIIFEDHSHYDSWTEEQLEDLEKLIDYIKEKEVPIVNLQDGFNMRGNILDRKSTRLNSSHVAISYAVFCLKKKI